MDKHARSYDGTVHYTCNGPVRKTGYTVRETSGSNYMLYTLTFVAIVAVIVAVVAYL